MKKINRAFIIYLLICAYYLFGFHNNCCIAEISPVHQSKDYSNQWKEVQFQLETLSIYHSLIDYGMSAEEATALFQQLSAEDVHALALTIDQVAPAGNPVSLALVIFLIVPIIVYFLIVLGMIAR